MILGTFAYGPLDRVLGTRKWLIWGGSMAVVVLLGVLILWPQAPVWAPIAMMAGIGFFGASFPVVIAHGRAFVPPHLVGRGVTLLNFFGIGGVGLMQFASGRIHAQMAGSADAAAPYVALFAFFAATLLIGCLIYLFSRDSLD
jgi:nitrate/nitrite transporter NarK